MLWKKLFRTMWQYKAQFISMILMITIGVGIFVGFNMEWVSIDINTKRFFKESHFADYRVVSELGFSEKDAENVENIKGVDKVSRYISVPADVKEKDGASDDGKSRRDGHHQKDHWQGRSPAASGRAGVRGGQ